MLYEVDMGGNTKVLNPTFNTESLRGAIHVQQYLNGSIEISE